MREDNAELTAQCELVISENRQLKEKLASLENRQKNIEDMLLALSTDLPKEKLAKLIDVQ